MLSPYLKIASVLARKPSHLKGSINKKILYYILVFSSVLTIIFTIYKLYQDYKIDENFIYNYLSNTAQLAQPVLSKAMWNFDDDAVTVLAQSISKSKQISSVKILDKDQSLYYSTGEAITIEEADHRIPLTYLDEETNELETLGYMDLYADFSSANQSLQRRFLFTLYTQFLKTFCVSFFVLFIIHRLISRHLIYLSNVFSSFSFLNNNNKEEEIKLDRKNTNDEIQKLLNSLNEYKDAIDKKNAEISKKNIALEKQIQSTETTKKQAEQQAKLIYSLFDAVETSIFIFTQDLLIKKINKFAREQTNLDSTPEKYRITNIIDLYVNDEKEKTSEEQFIELLHQEDRKKYTGQCNYKNQLPFSATITIIPLSIDETNIAKEYALIIENHYQKEEQAELNYNATHDFLTDLLNRYQFDKETTLILEKASKDSCYTIGFIDLDRFKSINDLFGHLKGDKVLTTVAQLLKKYIGKKALIARQGGDEFIFIVEKTLDEALLSTKKFQAALRKTVFQLNDQSFKITASIGLARINTQEDTVVSVISKADEAAYLAKNSGGNCVELFTDKSVFETSNTKLEDYETINFMSKKLQDPETVQLYSQQIVPLQSSLNLPLREEILIRVENDDGILLLPDQFIPVLERSRLTHLVDRLVIKKLLIYIAKYKSKHKALNLNINLSPISLLNWETRRGIIDLLNLAQKNNTSICFELTENAILHITEELKSVFKTIKKHHGLIAIDDFGKGYASYGHFSSLEVDMIKIDGSLIKKVDTDEKTLAIVRSIYSIADSINALTVAEHVNNRQQTKLLTEIGIDYIQSYQSAMPKPIQMP